MHPQAIDLGLDRLRSVLGRLQWRQPRVPVITVGGTNGKGSVTAYCAAILTAAGYRVGVFNSPHLRDYRERVRVGDRLVTSDELVRAFERIEAARLGTVPDAVNTPGAPAPVELSLTFFEYNALAAFLIFEAAELDAWVLEVGLGGRLDAVNVIDAAVAVVVSIGFDHQEFLGQTLDLIAGEKAGIFRPGKVAVLGSRELPPVLVDIAASLGALPKRLGIEFDYTREASGWRYRGTRWDLPSLPPPALAGDVQFANAATALAALEELEPRLPAAVAGIAQGLRTVQLSGRFQVIAAHDGQPAWILDVAHNPDAARVLAHNLRSLANSGKTFAVCGILTDKDASAIAAEVQECFDAWWVVPTEGARGTRAADLADRIAGQIRVPLVPAADIAAACAAASAAAGPMDRIVVFGSFHTVGPALDWLESQGLLPRLM